MMRHHPIFPDHSIIFCLLVLQISFILPFLRDPSLYIINMDSHFSGNESKSFLHVSADNRIHLWDTDTSNERRSYVEKNNLAHSYTCSCWKAGKKDNLGYFAVGASDGTVIVWDLTRGIVSKVFGQVNESPIPSSIAFSNDTNAIFVASSSNSSVVQYDLSNGEQSNEFKVGKRGINKITMNPKGDPDPAPCSSSHVNSLSQLIMFLTLIIIVITFTIIIIIIIIVVW